jgi:lipoprotein signal peptidase
LYNTGLVFHLLALQTGSTSIFLKALELYKLSMIILEDNAKNGFYVSELDILILALTNNMGHCHSHFNNLDDVSMCLQRICKVFLLSVSTVLLSDDEYVFFYRVTLTSPHRTPVLAPAA